MAALFGRGYDVLQLELSRFCGKIGRRGVRRRRWIDAPQLAVRVRQ